MEELLEEYDIIVRYSISDDIDTMYIMSNDVVRIIETLKELLGTIEILENTAKNNEWLFQLDTDFDNTVKSLLEAIYDFPLSIYQEEGRSNREEAKYYLRLNYGNDVI